MDLQYQDTTTGCNKANIKHWNYTLGCLDQYHIQHHTVITLELSAPNLTSLHETTSSQLPNFPDFEGIRLLIHSDEKEWLDGGLNHNLWNLTIWTNYQSVLLIINLSGCWVLKLLKFSHYFEIWHVIQPQCCQDTYHISQRLKNSHLGSGDGSSHSCPDQKRPKIRIMRWEKNCSYNKSQDQCSILLPINQPETDNFGGGPGTLKNFFFNFILWFGIQGMRTDNYFEWVLNTARTCVE